MSLFHEIPFLRNVVLTDLVNNFRPLGNLIGSSIMPTANVPTRTVEWEQELGGRNIAPIVAWDAQSPLVQHPGVLRKSAEAVDIRQKYALREADLLFLRQPGERESRAGRDIVTGQLNRMRSNIETRIEAMRWSAMLTGAISYDQLVDGERLVITIAFDTPATQFVSLTGTAKWDAPTTATARTDFANALRVIREGVGRRVTVAMMNSNTHMLLDNQDLLKQEFRYVEGANDLIKSEHVTAVISNIRIVDYDEGYKEDVNFNGTFVYFLPNNKVLFAVGATEDGEKYGDIAYAPHMLADGTVVSGTGAENWTSPDPTREYIRVACVVMPRIFHPDWVYVLTVA